MIKDWAEQEAMFSPLPCQFVLVDQRSCELTLRVLVTTIDAQWEGMGDVGSARYEPALLPPCPTIRALSYSNCQRSTHSFSK